MLRKLFTNAKRTETNDGSRSGTTIFVPGGGRSSQRTKVNIGLRLSPSPALSSSSLSLLSGQDTQENWPPVSPMPPGTLIASVRQLTCVGSRVLMSLVLLPGYSTWHHRGRWERSESWY